MQFKRNLCICTKWASKLKVQFLLKRFCSNFILTSAFICLPSSFLFQHRKKSYDDTSFSYTCFCYYRKHPQRATNGVLCVRTYAKETFHTSRTFKNFLLCVGVGFLSLSCTRQQNSYHMAYATTYQQCASDNNNKFNKLKVLRFHRIFACFFFFVNSNDWVAIFRDK